jgi:hypothetical protein
MIVALSIDSDMIKEKLLANPKRVLSIAKNMGTNVSRAERIYDELTNDSNLGDEWLNKLEEMVDLAIIAIIDDLRTEFKNQGLGEFDVEKYFLKAMWELKRGTPGSVKMAQDSIKRAKVEAKKQEQIKKEALSIIFEIETILKETREVGKAWSSENNILKMEASLREILKASERGNYELALHLANAALGKLKDLRDIKFTALRYAAKAGHVVGKAKAENPSSSSNDIITRLNTLLSTIRYLLEEENYPTALLLAKEVKREAEKLLPPDKTRISNFICPLCFNTKCPNPYCNLSISPSPLLEETCRTWCSCGTFYHICCLQKGEDITCASCHNPLKG